MTKIRDYVPAGTPQKHDDGYIRLRVPWHPNAHKNGQILEHTLVMSAMLGRPLVDKENVHHKNGQRDDNRPKNLELWSTKQPKGQRVQDKIEFAIEILALYAPERLLADDFRPAE